MTTVSVVIPAYESADTLPRAIDSALAQTHDDLEVLVVDDASSDETPAVARSYDDPRVELLVHDRNRGGSAARNTGIEAASGEFVALLDADDEYHSEKVERQLARLETVSEGPPSAEYSADGGPSDEWVGAYCAIEKELPPRIQRLRAIAPDRLTSPATNADFGKEGSEELIRDVLLRGGAFGGSSSLLVRRDVAEEMGGFDPAFPRHQDLEFVGRLLRHGKLAHADDVLVRKYPSGRPSADSVAEAKRLLFRTFDEEIRRLEAEGVPVTKHHQHELARHYLMDGQWREAAECLARPESHLDHDGGMAADDALDLLWPVALGVYETVTGR